MLRKRKILLTWAVGLGSLLGAVGIGAMANVLSTVFGTDKPSAVVLFLLGTWPPIAGIALSLSVLRLWRKIWGSPYPIN